MRSRERSERRAEPELFPKPLCRKGASDPTDRREGGGASDFGLTYPSMRSSLFGFTELILLIGLRLFYRKLSCFTFQRRKVNLGRKSFAFLDLVSNKAKLLSRILGVRRCNFDFLSLKEIKKVKNFLSKV